MSKTKPGPEEDDTTKIRWDTRGKQKRPTYRLRETYSGKDANTSRRRYYFTVPSWIAEQLVEKVPDQRYEVILTQQGILFRPVKPPPRRLPQWVRRGAEAREVLDP